MHLQNARCGTVVPKIRFNDDVDTVLADWRMLWAPNIEHKGVRQTVNRRTGHPMLWWHKEHNDYGRHIIGLYGDDILCGMIDLDHGIGERRLTLQAVETAPFEHPLMGAICHITTTAMIALAQAIQYPRIRICGPFLNPHSLAMHREMGFRTVSGGTELSQNDPFHILEITPDMQLNWRKIPPRLGRKVRLVGCKPA